MQAPAPKYFNPELGVPPLSVNAACALAVPLLDSANVLGRVIGQKRCPLPNSRLPLFGGHTKGIQLLSNVSNSRTFQGHSPYLGVILARICNLEPSVVFTATLPQPSDFSLASVVNRNIFTAVCHMVSPTVSYG